MLLSIQGGSNLGIFEINDAAQLVKEAAHPEANIIFGTVIDDTLGDEVRVTVIAAGFDGGEPQQILEVPSMANRPSAPSVPAAVAASGAGDQDAEKKEQDDQQRPQREQQPVSTPSAPVVPDSSGFDSAFENDLDIPDFLK